MHLDKHICTHAATTGVGGSPATATTTRVAQAASQNAKSSPHRQLCTKIVTNQNAPTTDRASHAARSPTTGKRQVTGPNAPLAKSLAFGASMMLQKVGARPKRRKRAGFGPGNNATARRTASPCI